MTRRPSPLVRLGLALCVVGIVGIIGSRSAAETDSAVEVHIRHIQEAILPPVLVKGEVPKTTILADRMAMHHVPGVSIAIIHDGKLEWARGFGTTKVGGPPVTTDTLFQAASISKPVTALAVLKLVEAGKLDLDNDVNLYLRTWKLPTNSFTDQKAVTLRELLTHTAGLTVHGFPGYASGEPLPGISQILDGVEPANSPAIRVDTTPGTMWRYSGGGYVVIRQVLEDVTGQPFAKLMEDSVLIPIGMIRSTYSQPLPATRLGEVAIPYDVNGNAIMGGPHVYPELAPDGLWTTPSDLARYAIELQRSLAGQSNRVLSASMTQQMLTPGMGNWGLGPEIGGSQQQSYFEHAGGNEGYRCNLVSYNAGNGAIIMTNGDDGGELMSEVLHTIAEEYDWPDLKPPVHSIKPIDPSKLDLLTGSYQFSDNNTITVTRVGQRAFAQWSKSQRVELFAESEQTYFIKNWDGFLAFDTDDHGKANHLTYREDGGEPDLAKRLDDVSAKLIAAELSARNKRIRNQTAAPGGETALRRNIDELRRGEPSYDLLSDALAQETQENLHELQSDITSYGPLQSVTFKSVNPNGCDIYTVEFANGKTEWRIGLTSDGKIDDINYRKVP